MNKKEALKAAIDGKKVRRKEWNPDNYIWFDGQTFRWKYSNITYIGGDYGEWEIVKEPVKWSEEVYICDDLRGLKGLKRYFKHHGCFNTEGETKGFEDEGRWRKVRITFEEL